MRIGWLPLVMAVMLLGFALWSIRAVLGPVVLMLALFFLLWPYRESHAIRRLLVVSGLLVLLWILVQARAIVYPTLAALAIAFLLDPAVDKLSARGVRRSLAALCIMFPFLAIIVAIALFGIPVFIDRASELLSKLPALYRYVIDWLTPIVQGLTKSQGGPLPEDLTELLPPPGEIISKITTGFVQVSRGVRFVLQLAAFLLLTPILTYYILVDFARLRASTRPYIPPAYLERLRVFGTIFQESVAAWFKGQLLVALIVGTLTLIGLYIVGYPYALVIGVTAGVMNLVPVIGFWVTMAIALVGAFFSPNIGGMIVRAVGVMLAVQLLEQNIFSPRIVGHRLGVNPVVLMVTMLSLSIFIGVLGIFLAPPAIGIARAAWTIWVRPYRREDGSLPSQQGLPEARQE